MALDVIPLIKSSPDPLIRLCITLWAPSLPPPPSLPPENHVTPKIFHPFPPPPATKKTGPLVCYIAFLVEIRVPFSNRRQLYRMDRVVWMQCELRGRLPPANKTVHQATSKTRWTWLQWTGTCWSEATVQPRPLPWVSIQFLSVSMTLATWRWKCAMIWPSLVNCYKALLSANLWL